ncbi:MAG: hypothetical protein WC749_14955 [Dehalococcoidia bacterium]
MKRACITGILIGVFVAASLIGGCGTSSQDTQESAKGKISDLTFFQDDFESGFLDLSRWQVTRENDFAQSIVDVRDVDPSEGKDHRLRLGANTIGTDDATVKFHGVRSLGEIDFSAGRVISFDLDWNNQQNGSYLTAGIFLSPVSTDTNPAARTDWISLEYIGVPPGQNARFQIARMRTGNLQLLFTEGWPEQQRTGRKIGNQHLELAIDSRGLKVIENGEDIFSTEYHGLVFTQAYIYFQMSSHSNYPAREVYFDNISIK